MVLDEVGDWGSLLEPPPNPALRCVGCFCGRRDFVLLVSPALSAVDQARGTIGTSNGLGLPLLGGPLFLAVFPVGLVNIFYKGNVQFEMDLLETPRDGYFMPLAIDSDSYKTTRDSLKALRIATVRPLNTTGCYMIVNGTKKVPLHVTEYFMGSATSHSYRLQAAIRFAQVRTVTIVTGNPMLDRVLKNITFKRKSRIIFDELGES